MTTAGARRPRIRLDVHVAPGERLAALREEVRSGLAQRPRTLSPKWLYDDDGCALFEEITGLAEYYQTRTELRILEREGPALVDRHAPAELVELGSGSSRKTRALLDPMSECGLLRRYVPFDIAPGALLAASARVAERYPEVEVHAVAGDFGRHLDRVPEPSGGRRMVAFLGGTIGNLHPGERRAFLRRVRERLDEGDLLLLGTDLVGDRRRTEAAYNDARGVTAAFNRNVLGVLNRELGADFRPDAFTHVARFDEEHAWIEMLLRADTPQRVRIPACGLELHIDAGEEIRTEISCKFTREEVAAMLGAAGLDLAEWHTDEERRFGVSVSVAA